MSDKMKDRGRYPNLAAFEFPSEGQGRSYDLVRTLSYLWRKGKAREGETANYQGKKIWMPDWKSNVSILLEWGLIKEEPSGHGNTRLLSLSDDGKEWAEDYFGYASAQEQAKAEILATNDSLAE
jgi:hypothetical protein